MILGTAIATALGLGQFAAALIGTAITLIAGVVVTAIGKALAPDPSEHGAGVGLSLQLGADVPRQCIFGEMAVRGHLVYVNTYGTNNSNIELVFIVSDGWCDSLQGLYVDGEVQTLNAVATVGNEDNRYEVDGYGSSFIVKWFSGKTTQAHDSELVTNSNPAGRWTANDKLTGMAYVSVNLTYDEELFTHLPNLLFVVRGLRLYDWRKDSTNGGSGSHRWNDTTTWEWSANPAVQRYNYQRGIFINGERLLGQAVALNDLLHTEYTTAANVCDESVALETTGTEARYEAHVLAFDDEPHYNALDLFDQAMAGYAVERQGQFAPIAGAGQSVQTTITDNNLVIGEVVRYFDKKSRAQLRNSVWGQFTDPANAYEMNSYPPIISAVLEAEDGGERLGQALPLPSVQSVTQAQRIAKIRRNENRSQRYGEITVGYSYVWLEAGDWIRWESARYGQYRAYARNFDGATFLDAGPMTGIANGKVGTVAAWINTETAGTARHVISSDGLRFVLWCNPSNNIEVQGENAAGTVIMNMRSSSAPFSAGSGWVHVILSWDLANGLGFVYVDGVEDTAASPKTLTNDTIAYAAPSEYSIAADVGGGNVFQGDLADVWLDPTSYIDLSVEANLRKFITADGGAVHPGSQGQLPTGSQPVLYLGDSPNWAENKGTGGEFTLTAITTDGGALFVSTTRPPLGVGSAFDYRIVQRIRTGAGPATRVRLSLQEARGSDYQWDATEEGDISSPPSAHQPGTQITTVATFNIAADTKTATDGETIPVLYASWTQPLDPTIDAVVIQWKKSGDSGVNEIVVPPDDGGKATDEAGVELGNILPGETYEARATIRTTPRRTTTWTSWDSTAAGASAIASTVIDDGITTPKVLDNAITNIWTESGSAGYTGEFADITVTRTAGTELLFWVMWAMNSDSGNHGSGNPLFMYRNMYVFRDTTQLYRFGENLPQIGFYINDDQPQTNDNQQLVTHGGGYRGVHYVDSADVSGSKEYIFHYKNNSPPGDNFASQTDEDVAIYYIFMMERKK